MPETYNATLIQDTLEYLAYFETILLQTLAHYDVEDYRSKDDVVEWIIREEIEVLYGLSCIGHNCKHFPYRRIRDRVDKRMSVSLETLTLAYIKAPRLYNDNIFVQVDLRGRDLYIQYYKHGMSSALAFQNS